MFVARRQGSLFKISRQDTTVRVCIYAYMLMQVYMQTLIADKMLH